MEHYSKEQDPNLPEMEVLSFQDIYNQLENLNVRCSEMEDQSRYVLSKIENPGSQDPGQQPLSKTAEHPNSVPGMMQSKIQQCFEHLDRARIKMNQISKYF